LYAADALRLTTNFWTSAEAADKALRAF